MKPYFLLLFVCLFPASHSFAAWQEASGRLGERIFVNNDRGAVLAEFRIQFARNTAVTVGIELNNWQQHPLVTSRFGNPDASDPSRNLLGYGPMVQYQFEQLVHHLQIIDPLFPIEGLIGPSYPKRGAFHDVGRGPGY